MLMPILAESILQKAAEDGSLDTYVPLQQYCFLSDTNCREEWPKTLQYILDRLDEVSTEGALSLPSSSVPCMVRST